MSETNSTTSFLIDSLLDNTGKKESESTSTNHNKSPFSHRDHLGTPKPNNYNSNSYQCQSYSDRSHYKPTHPHPIPTNHETAYIKTHTHSFDPRYQRPPYNSGRFYHWSHNKQIYPQNIYSYYSNGVHPCSYYEYIKSNPVPLTYSSSTTATESPTDHSLSMVTIKNAPNYEIKDSLTETPKKVVLSEESYLKLLESYRFSEELRNNAIFKKKRKQRTIFTKQQTELLESVFNRNEYITLDERASLAKQLKISEKQVKIWFQNRRNKLKKINISLNTTDMEEKIQCNSAETEEDDDDEEECNTTTVPICAPDD